jgi:transposase-like protein
MCPAALLLLVARRSRELVWFVDDTYVKLTGDGRFVYRAIDEHCQVIDVLVSKGGDIGLIAIEGVGVV